jgi:hypothetical protein
MFISKHRGKEFKRPVYRILESYREGGEVRKRFIVNLGKYSSVELAYQAELAKYIRVSNKMERLEYVMSCMQGKGA